MLFGAGKKAVFSGSDGIIIVHHVALYRSASMFDHLGFHKDFQACSHVLFHHQEMGQLSKTNFGDVAGSRARLGREHEPAGRGVQGMLGRTTRSREHA